MTYGKKIVRAEKNWEFPWVVYIKRNGWLDIVGNFSTRAEARRVAKAKGK